MSERLSLAQSLLSKLIAFDSESHKSNLPIIDFMETYLKALGLECVKTFNEHHDKATLFTTIGPKIDSGIVLSGHTDTVSVLGQAWSSDPFILRQDCGKLYGRGACDMKGFIALCLAMVPVFQRQGLKRPIHLLFSYDEEVTCLGPVAIIELFGKELPNPGAVIVGEPTSMQVADAHKAIATYTTTVFGYAGHSAKPHLGANAIEIAADLIVELYRINRILAQMPARDSRFEPAGSTVHVGVISGGNARNILADKCCFLWEFRASPEVPISVAKDRFDFYVENSAIKKLCRYVPDLRIETLNEIEIPGLAPNPNSQMANLAMMFTQVYKTIAVPFATEAGRFAKAHIDTIICGPGSIDQAHQPDEFITLDQLVQGLDFLDKLAKTMAE